MSTTVDIPGGQAVLRDKLKQRQRRELEIAMFAIESVVEKLQTAGVKIEAGMKPQDVDTSGVKFTAQEARAMLDFQDATILAFLESWTLQQPVPTTAEQLGDVDTDVYDALAEATRGLGAGAVDVSENPAPESPTGPSSGSETDLRDVASSESTRLTVISGSDGGSTDTAPYTVA